MIQTGSPHLGSKCPPFLPNNFYEAPQYASFRPKSVLALDDSALVPAIPAPATIPPAAQAVLKRQRRSFRTVMHDADMRIQGAKIDLSTGEVSPHEYKDYFAQRPKARRDSNAPDLEPFWMRLLPPVGIAGFTPQEKDSDNSRKKLANGAKIYLQDYVYLADAVEDYPALDHMITGAAALDMGGNTRGLNKNLLFILVQNLDIISPMQVREAMRCSKSHSEKVAVCLRIIVTAFMQWQSKQNKMLASPNKEPCGSEANVWQVSGWKPTPEGPSPSLT